MIDGLQRRGAPNLELMPPTGRGFLLVEFGADSAAAGRRTGRTRSWRTWRACRGAPTCAGSTPRQKPEPSGRSASRARAPPRTLPGQPPRWEGWDDAAVAPEKLGAYLRELRALLNEFGTRRAYYGHFGHGCIHMQTSFDLQSEPGIRKYAEFIDRAADLVVRYGGSISGEHGDGQARGALLPKMFGPEVMDAFRQFKRAWDPRGRMNPETDRRLPADREPAPWRRLQAGGAGDALHLPG